MPSESLQVLVALGDKTAAEVEYANAARIAAKKESLCILDG